MIGQFEELLHELGKVFRLELKVDRHSACSIRLSNELTLQLQLDREQENLWIFAKLGEIPPGKFREELLFETLKANGKPDPLPAALSYIAKDNALAIFQIYPLSILTGERLAALVGSILEMAKEWQNALLSGRTKP
jgi:hypothetical protein